MTSDLSHLGANACGMPVLCQALEGAYSQSSFPLMFVACLSLLHLDSAEPLQWDSKQIHAFANDTAEFSWDAQKSSFYPCDAGHWFIYWEAVTHRWELPLMGSFPRCPPRAGAGLQQSWEQGVLMAGLPHGWWARLPETPLLSRGFEIGRKLESD